jgi:hypothetical protein
VKEFGVVGLVIHGDDDGLCFYIKKTNIFI